ncbi:MAG: ABC transporter permease, partial [Clostridia bacterium]
MLGNIYGRSIRRTIFGSMGRYIAILAIIALGVGFFAGIKDTKDSMMLTCNKYVDEYRLYDFRLLSTYGFTDDDVEAIAGAERISVAEGSVTTDFFSEDRSGNSIILRAHSITENVNKVDLLEGRMPEKANECVADDHFFSKKDIGRTIKVTDENTQAEKDALK